MKKSKIALLTASMVLSLLLASCAMGRNLRNAGANNPVNNPPPTTIPTLVVAPTSAMTSQTSAAVPTAQPTIAAQSQPVSNDDLDAILQDAQAQSEPDVSVDNLETPPPTDDLVDLNSLNQDIQGIQQLLDGLK